MCGLLSPLEESGIDWRSLNQVLQGQYMSFKTGKRAAYPCCPPKRSDCRRDEDNLQVKLLVIGL